jgi:TonB family protein
MNLRMSLPKASIIAVLVVIAAGAAIGQLPQPAPGTKPTPRVSGGVMAGNLLTKVNAVYPPDAKADGISGTVVLRAIIGADGIVQNLTVVAGPPVLASAALDAVRQWTYKPHLLNGNPTAVDTVITVNFSLQP